MMSDSERGDISVNVVVALVVTTLAFGVIYIISNTVISQVTDAMVASPALSQSTEQMRTTILSGFQMLTTFMVVSIPLILVVYLIRNMLPMTGGGDWSEPSTSSSQPSGDTSPAVNVPPLISEPAPSYAELTRYSYANPFAEPEEQKPDHQYHDRFEAILDTEAELEK